MSDMRLVDVCVCTYRRDSIVETLTSISGQQLSRGIRVRVIVADNDATRSAESRVQDCCTALGLEYLYVHAPARNISVARNAALDAATAPLIAFIDDDETATPLWLGALVECHDATNAAIVFGPVQAVYGNGPSWLHEADLHSIRPAFRKGNVIATGYTCNVLLDRGVMTREMQQCRFDPALGRSGGEDTLFFHQLYSLGAQCAFAETAVAQEGVPPHRGRLRWLLKRSFRCGQTHARVLFTTGTSRPRMIVIAGAKLGYCLLGVALGLPSRTRWRRMAVRAALHAGVVCRIAGLRDLSIY